MSNSTKIADLKSGFYLPIFTKTEHRTFPTPFRESYGPIVVDWINQCNHNSCQTSTTEHSAKIFDHFSEFDDSKMENTLIFSEADLISERTKLTSGENKDCRLPPTARRALWMCFFALDMKAFLPRNYRPIRSKNISKHVSNHGDVQFLITKERSPQRFFESNQPVML
jgi:hypothetical protein